MVDASPIKSSESGPATPDSPDRGESLVENSFFYGTLGALGTAMVWGAKSLINIPLLWNKNRAWGAAKKALRVAKKSGVAEAIASAQEKADAAKKAVSSSGLASKAGRSLARMVGGAYKLYETYCHEPAQKLGEQAGNLLLRGGNAIANFGRSLVGAETVPFIATNAVKLGTASGLVVGSVGVTIGSDIGSGVAGSIAKNVMHLDKNGVNTARGIGGFVGGAVLGIAAVGVGAAVAGSLVAGGMAAGTAGLVVAAGAAVLYEVGYAPLRSAYGAWRTNGGSFKSWHDIQKGFGGNFVNDLGKEYAERSGWNAVKSGWNAAKAVGSAIGNFFTHTVPGLLGFGKGNAQKLGVQPVPKPKTVSTPTSKPIYKPQFQTAPASIRVLKSTDHSNRQNQQDVTKVQQKQLAQNKTKLGKVGSQHTVSVQV